MFSHTLFVVVSFSLFLLPFTSQLDLKVQIIGWRHLEAYRHLLSLTPANRFEITLSKNGQNASEPPMVCRTGHYDVATMPLPNAWLMSGLKRKSQKTSEFVGGSEMVLSIFTPSDGKHHGIIHFHLLSRRYFVRVTLTGDGNPPTAEILSKQQLKLPVKHLLFKIQEQASKRTTESMLLLKRIECQSGGWSIEDQTAGQKVLLRKRDQVCEDDVYLMHYAQIEEVGQMGRQEVPMQPFQLLCDEAIHELDAINIYNIGFKNGQFSCKLEANQMSPEAVKLVMDSGQQNIIDIWSQVVKMKLSKGNMAKRQKITHLPVILDSSLQSAKFINQNEQTAEQQGMVTPPVNCAPNHQQQLRIVNAFVEKNPKLQAVIVHLKSIKEKKNTNFMKNLNEEERKTFSNALAYLGQAVDYKLGTLAVAEVLGINKKTVAVNRHWVQVRSRMAKPMSGRRCLFSEEKMQQNLKNVEDDAQKQSSQQPAEAQTTNMDNEDNVDAVEWSPSGRAALEEQMFGQQLEEDIRVPNYQQQLRIVNAFVEKYPKLQAVIVHLKSIKENSQKKENFRKKLSEEQHKTLSNALAYLGQAVDYKICTQAVADVLGIGNTTVAVNRHWVQVRKAKPMSGSGRRYLPFSVEKMQQILKNVEEDAQKLSSQQPAEAQTTNMDNEDNVDAVEWSPSGRAALEEQMFGQQLAEDRSSTASESAKTSSIFAGKVQQQKHALVGERSDGHLPHNIDDYDVEIAKQHQKQHQEHQELAKSDFLQSIGEDEPLFSKEDLDNYIARMDEGLPSSSSASEQQRPQHLHGEHICDMSNRNPLHSTSEFSAENPHQNQNQLISPSPLAADQQQQREAATEENNRSLDKGKGKATITQHQHEDGGSQQQQPKVAEANAPPNVHRDHSYSDAELNNWDIDVHDLDWDL